MGHLEQPLEGSPCAPSCGWPARCPGDRRAGDAAAAGSQAACCPLPAGHLSAPQDCRGLPRAGGGWWRSPPDLVIEGHGRWLGQLRPDTHLSICLVWCALRYEPVFRGALRPTGASRRGRGGTALVCCPSPRGTLKQPVRDSDHPARSVELWEQLGNARAAPKGARVTSVPVARLPGAP